MAEQRKFSHYKTKYKFKGLRQNSVCIWLDHRSEKIQILASTSSLLLWAKPLTCLDIRFLTLEIYLQCLSRLFLWSKVWFWSKRHDVSLCNTWWFSYIRICRIISISESAYPSDFCSFNKDNSWAWHPTISSQSIRI